MIKSARQSEQWIPLGKDYPNLVYMQRGSFVWIADRRDRQGSRMGPIELCGRTAEWGARALAAEFRRSASSRSD